MQINQFLKKLLINLPAAAILAAGLFLILSLSVNGHAQPGQPAANIAVDGSNTGAKEQPEKRNAAQNEVSEGTTIETGYGIHSMFEFINSLMVLSFSVLTLLLLFFLLRKNTHLKAEEILRIFGVILVIVGTLLFVTAGFSSTEIAPALGLFGTIAGYLLGKSEKKEENAHA